ncbi:hypothetical protein PAE90_31485, partial [Pseudomonas aeruginosa]|nr:hypothetical protein [Pseudomonas aeruginosa]
IWLNGAPVLPGQVLTPADGWKHVRISKKSAQGYDNGFPFLYMSLGASAAMACPAFFGGLVDPGIHVAPIATVNSQSA